MADKLIMIDGNSLIFRAFHALPPMNMDNGVQVNFLHAAEPGAGTTAAVYGGCF